MALLALLACFSLVTYSSILQHTSPIASARGLALFCLTLLLDSYAGLRIGLHLVSMKRMGDGEIRSLSVLGWLSDFWNLLDVCTVVGVAVVCLSIHYNRGGGAHLLRTMASATLTLLWLKLIGYLRVYSTKIGIYISCLVQIFRMCALKFFSRSTSRPDWWKQLNDAKWDLLKQRKCRMMINQRDDPSISLRIIALTKQLRSHREKMFSR